MSEQNLKWWVDSMRERIPLLECMDLGYPLGVHEVRAPVPHEWLRVPESLKPLYQVCDGLSFPNVHNGYFIESAVRVVSAQARGEPVTVAHQDGSSTAITVFGADGGGSRFAVAVSEGSVWYLPSDCAVHSGTLVDDASAKGKRLSPNLGQFLRLVLADVDAFLSEDIHHKYIGSR